MLIKARGTYLNETELDFDPEDFMDCNSQTELAAAIHQEIEDWLGIEMVDGLDVTLDYQIDPDFIKRWKQAKKHDKD